MARPNQDQIEGIMTLLTTGSDAFRDPESIAGFRRDLEVGDYTLITDAMMLTDDQAKRCEEFSAEMQHGVIGHG